MKCRKRAIETFIKYTAENENDFAEFVMNTDVFVCEKTDKIGVLKISDEDSEYYAGYGTIAVTLPERHGVKRIELLSEKEFNEKYEVVNG